MEVRKQLVSATKIINDFENPKLSEENGTRFSIRGNAWSDVLVYNPGDTIGEYIQRVNAWKQERNVIKKYLRNITSEVGCLLQP